MMALNLEQKPIQSLILDTGPLIKNAVSISTLINSAEELYTTPAIISEIRDEATRSRVQTTLMPFLKIRTARPASYDAVVTFSKKTGDFSVLSRQDLGILALAYEIHCEKNGGPWGLREAPKQSLMKKPEDEHGFSAEALDAKSFSKPAIKDLGELSEAERALAAEATEPSEEAETSAATKEIRIEQAGNTSLSDAAVLEVSAQAQTVDHSPRTDLSTQDHMSSNDQPNPDSIHPQQQSSLRPEVISSAFKDLSISAIATSSSQITPPSPPASHDSDCDSDGGGWITPSNLSQHQAKDAGLPLATISKSPQLTVATMTIDFAMQNVLLQMNLHLLSTNMQRLKRVATKVLRCHACFNIVRDTTKQFCPRCGQPSLTRVSCSTDAKGEFRIHLAKNYQHNKRGDRFSVPKPVAGTANGKWSGQGGGKGGWGRDLVFTEDQKEYVRAGENEKRAKRRDLMHEDYLPGIVTGERAKGREGGRMKVGGGRDVNSRKRF